MKSTNPTISRFGLENHGLDRLGGSHWNLDVPLLYERALAGGEGVLSRGGALVTETGVYTGRSPNDKFIVREASSEETVDWGPVNQPIGEDVFDRLHLAMTEFLAGRDVFVQDCFAGADPDYRLPVRVITLHAWHSLFARNMFIPPKSEEMAGFEPGFTVLHAPDFQADPAAHGTNSEAFIIVHLGRRMVLIGGTHYTGEIKKSIFSVLNYLLPAQNVMPMHCSANIGADGDTAIFFGLSGTGKTTLSADASRTLIGDDEHGWSDNGVFNFEGGCYAKTINLSQQAEPEIYAACHRFGTILENVVLDPATRMADFDDGSLTENTRASYPLSFIPNASETGQSGHPDTIIMLTADAFGVLPPISRLSPEQAMYHFLSGYTARVAGTERGMGSSPEATFSACFGGPFLPRHPAVYAELLREKIARHGATCWLVNTGWSGGAHGVGSRMKIAHTRTMVRAALDGTLNDTRQRVDPNFGVRVPEACDGLPADVLNPRETWADKSAYDTAANDLARRFEKNFERFDPHVDDTVKAAGIHAGS